MNTSVPSAIPAAARLGLGALGLAGLLQASAHAAPPEPVASQPAPLQLAAIVPQAGGATPGDASTAVSAAAGQKPSDFGGAVTVETSVGIGTFAPSPHDNALVSTTVLGSVFYRLSDQMRLTLAGSVTWYNVNDFSTPLPDNEALLSDLALGISHSSIYRHAASGFNLSGAFRVLLPTSPASQYQNRWFTLTPGVTASLPVGPFNLSWSFGFGKFFAASSVPTVDCSDFPDPEQCLQGRGANPALGFETERRGGEVWVPGLGMNSFFFSNNLSLSTSPVDRLTIALNFGIFNYFGLRSLPVDELSSPYAQAGRAHRDRLISSLALSYQLLDSFALSTNLVSDTSQPFGARGDAAPVIFDFTRAPDNITTLSLALTGTF
jgi:hypothetical protein